MGIERLSVRQLCIRLYFTKALQIIDSDPHYLFLAPSQFLVFISIWDSISESVQDLQCMHRSLDPDVR